jgi:hypothetical protein
MEHVWGTRRPLPAGKGRRSGCRNAVLWPEEVPGSDRIMDQMFSFQILSRRRLKRSRVPKNTFYHGLVCWFLLKPGRVMFRDARLFVQNCTITVDQNQRTEADAIFYFDRFAHQRHPRPHWLVRSLHPLY